MWHQSRRVGGSTFLLVVSFAGGVARSQNVPSKNVPSTQTGLNIRDASGFPILTMGAPGSNTYANYTPFACVLAAERFGAFAEGDRRLTWRDRWPVTPATRVADSVAADSAAQIANRDVRRCLALHPVAQTRTEHLLGLGTAWLGVGDDANAAAAFRTLQQRMARAPIAERAFALQQSVEAYAGSGGARFDTALAYMRALDALGQEASGYRLTARNSLYNVAASLDSLSLMAEHARIGLALQQTITGDTEREWLPQVLIAIANQADLEARQGHYKTAVDRLEQATKTYEPIDAGLTGGIIGAAQTVIVPLGWPFPPLKATYAYAATGSTPMSTPLIAPVKGRVTLVVHGLFPSFGAVDYGIFRAVTELQEQFGSSIDVVMLGQTTGAKGPRKITAAEEAPLFEEFHHNYLRMKLPLVVYDRAITGTREDGALFHEQNPNDLGVFVVVDKRGEIRFRNVNGQLPRLRLTHLIEAAVRE